MAEHWQLKRSLGNPRRIQELPTSLNPPSYHPPIFMSHQTILPSAPQASSHQQLRHARFVHLLWNEPFQQTLLNCITDPLDKNILSNTHTLLGLRKVHTDAVARTDFLLSMNANRLVQWNVDRLFDDLYPVLQPDTLHPTMPPTISPSPSRHFSPMNNPKWSSSTPAAPRCVPWKKAPNPYPVWSPSIEQIYPKKLSSKVRTIIDLSSDSDNPVEGMPNTSFVTRETPAHAQTHDCTVCGKRGHDEVHCHWYHCKYCQCSAPKHLPVECPNFLKKETLPIPSTSVQTKPPRHDTPPPQWHILTPPIFNYTPARDANGDPYDDGNCCEWIDNYLNEEAEHNMAT